MPEFTDDQLRYHAAKAGYPAKELAAELLQLRGHVFAALNEDRRLLSLTEAWEDQYLRLADEIVSAHNAALGAANAPELGDKDEDEILALCLALNNMVEEVLRLREKLDAAMEHGAVLAHEVLDLTAKLDRVVGSGIWTLDTILKACLHVLDPDSLLASHVRGKIEELADLKEANDGE